MRKFWKNGVQLLADIFAMRGQNIFPRSYFGLIEFIWLNGNAQKKHNQIKENKSKNKT